MRQVEVGPTSGSVLEALRDELEGLSKTKVVLAHRASARARVKKIRQSHIAQCGQVFFRANRFGILEFNPQAGRYLLNALFGE